MPRGMTRKGQITKSQEDDAEAKEEKTNTRTISIRHRVTSRCRQPQGARTALDRTSGDLEEIYPMKRCHAGFFDLKRCATAWDDRMELLDEPRHGLADRRMDQVVELGHELSLAEIDRLVSVGTVGDGGLETESRVVA